MPSFDAGRGRGRGGPRGRGRGRGGAPVFRDNRGESRPAWSGDRAAPKFTRGTDRPRGSVRGAPRAFSGGRGGSSNRGGPSRGGRGGFNGGSRGGRSPIFDPSKMKEKSKTENFDLLAQDFKIGNHTFSASKEAGAFCKIELKVFLTKQPKQFSVVINQKGSTKASAAYEKLRTKINFDDLKRFEVRSRPNFLQLNFFNPNYRITFRFHAFPPFHLRPLSRMFPPVSEPFLRGWKRDLLYLSLF